MKHIDKVFKDKLFYQSAEVPEDMWDKIAPALEEKSGRAIIWFWLAGIFALLLGGLAYTYISSSDTDSTIAGPLAKNMATMPTISNTPKETNAQIEQTPEPTSEIQNKTQVVTKENVVVKPTQKVTKKSSKRETPAKSIIETKPLKTIGSTVSSSQVSPELKYGKPANLVITKSYISDKGSFIEKSELGEKKGEIEYNVFINSEGLNAGTLMRVVEPLEYIPLPAFQKSLKKKTLTTHLTHL